MTASGTSHTSASVAELQGFYGSVTVSERVIQQVWMRQDFNTNALFLVDGRPVEVLHPGTWNHIDGPDFRDARILVDGEEYVGDVEIHLYPEDWSRHGHTSNPSFRRVVLHVSLFDPAAGGAIRLGDLPLLVLLPRLDEDLEAVLLRNAVATTENPDLQEFHWLSDWLLVPGPEERAEVLFALARRRWAQKMDYARRRLETFPWDVACHQVMLEVLGYRRNRAPMHEIALAYPLELWEKGAVGPEDAYASRKERWILSGMRPGNHPLHRLRSYAQWVRRNIHWPESVFGACRAHWKGNCDASTVNARAFRSSMGLAKLSRHFREGYFGGLFGESRHATFWCDGLLPLLAARTDSDLFLPWFFWYAGDIPSWMEPAYKTGGLSMLEGSLFSNGHVQGLLQLALDSSGFPAKSRSS